MKNLFRALAIGAVALGAAPAFAQDPAASFPSRAITFVLPGVGAGGTTDILTRLIGKHLTDYWKQPMVVEVKPGGAQGMVGLGAALQAPGDGHTVALVHVNNISIAPHSMKAPFAFSDISYVAMVSIYPSLLVVGESVPAKTFQEFVAYMKANPGKVAFGNSGPNGYMDLAGRRLAKQAGVDILSVSYNSQPESINAILSNEIQAAFATPGNVLGQIKAGKLKALAVTTKERLRQMPDVPAVAEFVPGYEALQWVAFGVRSSTPEPIVAKLAAGLRKALQEKDVQDKLAEFFDSGDSSVDTPAKLKAFAEKEHASWADVVKSAK